MSTTAEPDNDEPEIVDSLPPELRKKITPELLAALTISIKRSWSGPLPPPEVLKQYSPAVQKAIVAQATAQMEHRHKIETKVINSNIKNASKGMTYAFWITLLMIGAGVFLIAIGKSTAGLIAIFGPAAFHGGNYFIQKWKEMRQISKDVHKENHKDVKENTAEIGSVDDGK